MTPNLKLNLRRKLLTFRNFAIFVLLLLALTVIINRVNAQSSIVISEEFDYVRQGTVGIITLTGPDMMGAVAMTLGHTYPFFPTRQGFASLISVPIQQKITSYPIQVTVTKNDGTNLAWQGILKVESGEFINEPALMLPQSKIYLLKPEIQDNEDERLLAVYGMVTPSRLWDGSFTRPVNGALSSPFGTWRTFNDGAVRRHTGYDFIASIGTPVMASGNGRVVFARALDIHGNSVIIDHGQGIFTEYSHLSEIYVVPGQMVMQGDVLGLSGTTGRITGPCVHWEVAINGNWVNPLFFETFKLPQ